MKDKNILQLESDFLKTLAQPTRLKILYFLKDGEKCACKIIPEMEEEQSNVSRHLALLREQGIVEARKEGVSVYYKVKDMRVFTLLSLVDEIVKAQIKEKAKLMKILG